MIRSMTGFGRGEATVDGRDITVEIKSVNHRYFEFNCRTTRGFGFLEEKLKSYIKERVSRGKIDMFVSLSQKEDTEATPANIRERHQQELQEMYQRLQQAQQDNSDNFQAEQQKKMQPVTQKVMDAVNAVAQQGGYVYIVDKNAAQGAGIVINEQLSTDVTGAIMQKLGMPESAAKPAAAPAK